MESIFNFVHDVIGIRQHSHCRNFDFSGIGKEKLKRYIINKVYNLFSFMILFGFYPNRSDPYPVFWVGFGLNVKLDTMGALV